MLATGQNSWFGSGSSSNPAPERCNGFYHMKTQTVVIGPVLPPKTQHFNLTSLAPTKYLSSDRIMTWSVHRFYIISRSSTSRFQNYDSTNIRCVAIENPRISDEIGCYFTTTQRILVASPFWMREVKELRKLHNLCTDHGMIRSEPKTSLEPKNCQSCTNCNMEPRSGSNLAKKLWVYVRSG